MNKRHPYRDMEREYITSGISLRELCRRHNISSHSVVVNQAKKHKWAEKREACGARASESFIEKHAARQADRVVDVGNDALELISEGINKACEDMKARHRAIDGHL